MGEFEARVASIDKGEWLETTPEVLKVVFPRGFGSVHGTPAEHVCYKGVLVCERGKKDAIIDKMEQSTNDRLHGAGEAKVISGK